MFDRTLDPSLSKHALVHLQKEKNVPAAQLGHFLFKFDTAVAVASCLTFAVSLRATYRYGTFCSRTVVKLLNL